MIDLRKERERANVKLQRYFGSVRVGDKEVVNYGEFYLCTDWSTSCMEFRTQDITEAINFLYLEPSNEML